MTPDPHLWRVLLVDDDPEILRMLSDYLKRQFELVTAVDGAQALEVVQREQIDAIVADHMMPGLTGIQLLEKAAELKPDVVRVLLTASERIDELRDAINKARVHRFLNKPVRLLELREVLAGALRERALETENRRLVDELHSKNALLMKALSEVQDHERKLQHQVEEATSSLRAANAELEKLALRDGLTGLYNHRYFQEALTAELARGARYGNPVGLVFLDVDHFKNYNDKLGHPAGDELLRQLARILTDTGDLPELRFRGRITDIAARYGGEEFVVLLPQTNKAGAIIRAQRLRESIDAFPFVDQHVQPGGSLTVSVGVAAFPDDAMVKDALISAADRALYAAKHAGRNRVRVAGTPPTEPPPLA
jgi:diguanylate cyclase (GGDEF)-like protein